MSVLQQVDEEKKIVECQIKVKKIYFPKNIDRIEEDSYAIFMGIVTHNLSGNYRNLTIKLKGNVPSLIPNIEYKVMCKLVQQHETYGDTYEIICMNRIVNFADVTEQKKFLASILAPSYVEKLFAKYDNVVDLLQNRDIDALTSIDGIGEFTAERIFAEFEHSKDYSIIYTQLNKLNLTQKMIEKLVKHYKSPDTVVRVIQSDPYRLTEVEGIGFKKSDEIALKMGIGKQDDRRVKGFIEFYLWEQGETGKSYILLNDLQEEILSALGNISNEQIIRNIKTLIDDNKVIKISNKIALTYFYQLEEKIANELMRLYENKPTPSEKGYTPRVFDLSDWKDTIARVESEQGYSFTEEQLSAIELITKYNVVCLTGLAGSGKSSTANGICALFTERKGMVSACALSGKAALRLYETTGVQGQTIHRLLGYNGQGFTYNQSAKLPTDVVIIDESTMINGNLFLALLEAIPTGAKLIIMGDVQQLTPIGNCQVFADILDSNTIPTVKLTKPHRQALRSGIIPTSIKVANQSPIFASNYTGMQIIGELQDMKLDITHDKSYVYKKIASTYKEELDKYDNVMEVQLCLAKRVQGDLCCYNLNKIIQKLVNKNCHDTNNPHIDVVLGKTAKGEIVGYSLYVGDKVINTKNNYNCKTIDDTKTSIFNGNMGIVQSIDKDKAIIDFIGIGTVIVNKGNIRTIELGYACTTHKLQGSQFDSVIVAIDNSSYIMNNAEWLYTALTRAKKYCVLLGENGAIQKAIRTKEVKFKQTFLKDFLVGESV